MPYPPDRSSGGGGQGELFFFFGSRAFLISLQGSKAFAIEPQFTVETRLEGRVARIEDFFEQQADLPVFLTGLMSIVAAPSDVHTPDRVDPILLGEFCEEHGGFGREVVVDAHHFLTFGKHTNKTRAEWVAVGVEVNLGRLLRVFWVSTGRMLGTGFDVGGSLVHKPIA